MSRIYSVAEIQAACAVMEALSQGVTIVEGTDMDGEIVNMATQASLSALRIIKTGLAEIEAEYKRANAPKD